MYKCLIQFTPELKSTPPYTKRIPLVLEVLSLGNVECQNDLEKACVRPATSSDHRPAHLTAQALHNTTAEKQMGKKDVLMESIRYGTLNSSAVTCHGTHG